MDSATIKGSELFGMVGSRFAQGNKLWLETKMQQSCVGGKETEIGRVVMEAIDREVTAVYVNTKRFHWNCHQGGITTVSAPKTYPMTGRKKLKQKLKIY